MIYLILDQPNSFNKFSPFHIFHTNVEKKKPHMKLVSPRTLWRVCQERSKVLCLDVGTSKIGVAISDEDRYVEIANKSVFFVLIIATTLPGQRRIR